MQQISGAGSAAAKNAASTQARPPLKQRGSHGINSSFQLQPASGSNRGTAQQVPQIRCANSARHCRLNTIHFPAIYPLRLPSVGRGPSRHHSVRGILTVVTIGLSGSRYLSGAAITPTVSAFMRAAGPGFSFNIGCCPTGLDRAALSIAKAHAIPFSFFKAKNYTAAALRARTFQMVSASQVLFSFPFSCSLSFSGSWLAVAQAAASGIPVFVALLTIQNPPLLGFPVWRNITGWQAAPAAALPFPVPSNIRFFQPIIHTLQTSLF